MYKHPFMNCPNRPPPPDRVLSWRVSLTMDVHFCIEAMKEAIARYGAPEIVNTDQGSQFT